MGKRGPAPAPTKLKLLRGETRSSRVNRREPQPRKGLPVMPAGMQPDAQKIWRRVIRDLGHTGVLTGLDTEILRVYCDAAARYQTAAVQLEATGPLVRGDRRGLLVKNPLHQIVRDNADLMRQAAREIGLTPSSRSGLVTPDAGEVDAFTAWEGKQSG